MRRGLSSAILAAIILALAFSPCSASADKLCQAKRIKVTKKGVGKPALKVAAVCPKGFNELLDLSLLISQAQGPKGDKGDPGVSALDPLPAGRTIVGVIGGDFQQDNLNLGDWRVVASLPIAAPAALGDADVRIQNNEHVDDNCLGASCLSVAELGKADDCTGSQTNPTAPPGKLCIYPLNTVNAKSIRSFPLPLDSGTPTRGVTVSWSAIGAGDTFFNGLWAFTAP